MLQLNVKLVSLQKESDENIAKNQINKVWVLD